MNRDSWTVLCLAYAIGLLSTGVLELSNPNPSWQQWIAVAVGLGFFSIVAAISMPRFWRREPRWQLWLVAGLVAILAVAYFQFRIPQPGSNDISRVLEKGNSKSQIVTVGGKILTQGKLTSNQRVQFWFEAKKLENTNEQVTGKLYVTVPISKGTDLYPGRQLTVTGILYQPRSPANPGSFDFKTYLARQGAFAGLKGQQIQFKERKKAPPWGLWQLRQRIINAQIRWLGNREGLLVSSMVLGQRAVDLPHNIRDSFIKAGLAHVLAASGFQVSLLLGAVIRLTGSLSPQKQFISGLCTLGLYVGLTGIQPSVMRAAVMGVGALIALVADRKVKQLGSLLLAGTILLLFNPLWIWDLGFQLSFLATFGLIVTMPALEKRLDWLPPAIATFIALPLAASLWTFPLLLHVFSVVATYSIPANIISAPLVTAISLGGMVSATAAVIYPLAGSAIAGVLYYPTYFLIQIVQFFTTLPGSSLAVGQLSLSLMLLIYGLMVLVWLNRWWQSRWWLVSLLIIILIVVPIRYNRLNLLQVSVFATKQEPVLIVQEREKVILINSGDLNTAKYTIIPFLNRQGINQIDCAVDFTSGVNRIDGWSEIEENLSIKRFFSDRPISRTEYQSLSVGNKISIGSIEIQSINNALQLQIQKQIWLLVTESRVDATNLAMLPKTVSVLLWSGKSLGKKWLDLVKPEIAIAVSPTLSQQTRQQLQQRGIQLYWTGRDGAIQWRREGGFQKTIETQEQEANLP
ncbi:competence protein [Hydrococcus rivularis NIES-593]|uniref:Competence protein n=1 Tax=Hydrococcus rivularis NIES-593 TaxID=1921803 RepID=A0A1U7HLU8_9CYAN|nr:ComEC/Rec2 family competence protein [Hydrococcus rivularis]OKH24547.1 competence protein [Hydrococcus rivularis NIES-593]